MSEFINFKSKIVEQKAKARLKNSGLLRRVGNRDYVSEEAASGVTKMQFCSDKFTDGDLVDLGYFANLKSLEISSQNVHDLSNLPALSSLEALDIDVPCGDAAPLAKFKKLKKLRLFSVLFTDFTPLASLSELRTLKLYDCGVRDVSFLGELKKLKSLKLSNNDISDVSPLARLANLTELWLDRNRIQDLRPLAALTKLKELNIEVNGVQDLAPIGKLSELEYLRADDNRIADVSPLANLAKLCVLYLSQNALTDVSALKFCRALENIHLDLNQILDITPLLALPRLKFLTADTSVNHAGFEAKFDKSEGLICLGDVDDEANYARYFAFSAKEAE